MREVGEVGEGEGGEEGAEGAGRERRDGRGERIREGTRISSKVLDDDNRAMRGRSEEEIGGTLDDADVAVVLLAHQLPIANSHQLHLAVKEPVCLLALVFFFFFFFFLFFVFRFVAYHFIFRRLGDLECR